MISVISRQSSDLDKISKSSLLIFSKSRLTFWQIKHNIFELSCKLKRINTAVTFLELPRFYMIHYFYFYFCLKTFISGCQWDRNNLNVKASQRVTFSTEILKPQMKKFCICCQFYKLFISPFFGNYPHSLTVLLNCNRSHFRQS